MSKIRSGRIRIGSSVLTAASLLYMYVPVTIFLLTWVKIYFALPVILIGCIITYMFFKEVISEKKEGEVVFSVAGCILMLLGIVLLAHICGYDGYMQQATDWSKHNAVLRDLIMYPWPVYYETHDTAMLTYYIGQYIVPAVAGKLTDSFEIAYMVLFVWNCIGMILFFTWILLLCKADNLKKQMTAFLVMTLFSGMLLIAQYLLYIFGLNNINSVGMDRWFITNGYYLQYRSVFVMFRWVFPQLFVPGICTALWLQYREKVNYYVYLLLPTMFFGTFQFVGIVMLAVLYVITVFASEKKGEKLSYVRKVVSPWNILWALSLGLLFLSYFWGNVMGEKDSEVGFGICNFFESPLIFVFYVIFCVFMFAAYMLCLYSAYRKDKVYWIVFGMLMLIPWLRMGAANDFCMCVSMPCLWIVVIMICDFLFRRGTNEKEVVAKALLIVFLCIGALSPIKEMSDIIRQEIPGVQREDVFYSLVTCTDRSNMDLNVDVKYNYFTYDIEDDFFVKYIAK